MNQKFRPALKLLFIIFISTVAFIIRFYGFKYISGDMRLSLLPWYHYIQEHGGYKALGDNFYNYTPSYLYLLTAITYIPNLLSFVVKIKLISVIFDFFAAIMMYKLVKLNSPKGNVPLLAYAAVLFAPTIIINSSYWGQCDIIHTSLLLTAVYFMCINRPLLSVLSFSVACSFKFLALFMLPFFLILLIKRRIPLRYVIIPFLVYLIAILPCYLLGRSFLDLLTIIFRQIKTYHSLSKNAPNLYVFLPRSFYNVGLKIGAVMTVTIVLISTVLASRKIVKITNKTLVTIATLSVAIIPFILPKMHDRYFFAADLLSIGLAFYRPGLWLIPVAFQVSSLIAYRVYFLRGDPLNFFLLKIAAILNALILILLVTKITKRKIPL